MSELYFSVEFGDADGPMSEVASEANDVLFEKRVVEVLGEECEVLEATSRARDPLYVVFHADFKRSNQELFEDYGRKGLSKVVLAVAEGVYGEQATDVSMEGRH